jgi:catechol 2,3-dioxygenase-like lactoylglutathione lyase family enzyme
MFGDRTLRDRINRVAHVVVNVSDLERSRAFYEAITPLRVAVRTEAPRQRFAGLGIERGRFDGYLMTDGSGGSPTAVHLVQWKEPGPVGEPYPVFWHVGLVKLAFYVPNLDAKIGEMRRLGLAPTNRRIWRRYLSLLDPDGAILSFIENPAERCERLLHTNPSVRDVGRSNAFYGGLLGLTLRVESVPCDPQPSSQGPGSDLSQWDSHVWSARGDDRFYIDVSQFHFPAPEPATATPYAEPNHLGIARVGLEVDDIDESYRILREARAADDGPRDVHPPEDRDYGPAIGIRRFLSFKDPDGIGLELVQARPVTPLTSCRNPVTTSSLDFFAPDPGNI